MIRTIMRTGMQTGIRTGVLTSAILMSAVVAELWAQAPDYEPVTAPMLLEPSPDDWLTYSRTYDNQRFSPLDQINRRNADQLRLAWSRGLSPGIHEHIPLVHDGVLFVANPGGMQALDATNGDLIWDYQRKMERGGRAGRTIALIEDLVVYSSPDRTMVALDARTGKVRWEKAAPFSSSGPKAFGDKVVAGLTGCGDGRDCIAAFDGRTGDEVWRFFTTPGPGEPGDETWGTVPFDKRSATPWGLPGAYDPARNLLYWGIANPAPHTRLKRHGGDIDDIPRSAPADLYSNSTVALDLGTGELKWYYQHLPGDDWDADHTQERILLRTRMSPDAEAVKWINPRVKQREEREIVVSLGEPGGIWVNDPEDGEFLWATPFPHDVPEFHIQRIDVETGKTYMNWDVVIKSWEDRHIMCFHNTKSYWPMAYHPGKNALFIPYHDQCVDTTANPDTVNGNGPRVGVLRPGADPNAYAVIAKVERLYSQRAPGKGRCWQRPATCSSGEI